MQNVSVGEDNNLKPVRAEDTVLNSMSFDEEEWEEFDEEEWEDWEEEEEWEEEEW